MLGKGWQKIFSKEWLEKKSFQSDSSNFSSNVSAPQILGQINDPSQLSDDVSRYEDAVQLRVTRPDDPHFFQLISFDISQAAGQTTYIVLSCLVDLTTNMVYPNHEEIWVYNALDSTLVDQISPFVLCGSGLVVGKYTFETPGITWPASPVDLSVMFDYICDKQYRYQFRNPDNIGSGNFANDVTGFLTTLPQLNRGASGNWILRLSYHRDIRKIIADATKYDKAKYTYAYPPAEEVSDEILNDDINIVDPSQIDSDDSFSIDSLSGVTSLSDFAIALGMTATQFNNLFVNVPRNCRVDTILTDYIWRTYQNLAPKVLIFKVMFGTNELMEKLPIHTNRLYKLSIVVPISNYVQYREISASNFDVIEARDRLKRDNPIEQKETIMHDVFLMNELDEITRQYVFGEITYEWYLATLTKDQWQWRPTDTPTDYTPIVGSSGVLPALIDELIKKWRSKRG